AEPVSAAVNKMIGAGLQEQASNLGPATLHFRIAEARILRLMDRPQMRRERKVMAWMVGHNATLRGWAWQIHFVRESSLKARQGEFCRCPRVTSIQPFFATSSRPRPCGGSFPTKTACRNISTS